MEPLKETFGRVSVINWKTIIVIVVIVAVIIIVAVFLLNHDPPVVEKPLVVDENIREFLKNDSRKLKGVVLTKELFDTLTIEDFTLYYFPNECPGYVEDILLYENTKYGKRYYLPEKHTLIKLLPEHDWTKEFTGEMWQKKNELTSNEQASGPVQECTELSSE